MSNKWMVFVASTLLLGSSFSFNACYNDIESDAASKPVANAGQDQEVFAGAASRTTLDGSASYDPLHKDEPEKLKFDWQLVSKPEGSGITAVGNHNSMVAELGTSTPGIYTVSLRVTTEDGRVSDLDYVTVTSKEKTDDPGDKTELKAVIKPILPYYCPAETITLDGSESTGPETMTYLWKAVDIGFHQPEIADQEAAVTTVIAPETSDGGNDNYSISLTVTDGKVDNIAHVKFGVKKNVARIDGPLTVAPGSTVTLTSENSCTEVPIVRYLWKQLSGEHTSVIELDTKEITFTAPEVSSVVVLQLEIFINGTTIPADVTTFTLSVK